MEAAGESLSRGVLLWVSPHQAPYFISKGESSQSSEEANFHSLFQQSCSYGLYNELVAIGEGGNVD